MRLLDLFCGAGGAAMGYSRAGFTDIVGVDIKPQKNYPFTFVLGDALEYVKAHGHEFDAIHASPPCQAYSTLCHHVSGRHDDLYDLTRKALVITRLPYSIENVLGAPYAHGVMMCGSMVGLHQIRRHRNFETSILIFQPECAHADERPFTVTSSNFTSKEYNSPHSRQPTFEQAQRLMGIDWMTRAELGQAIPPAYTEFIGRQLLATLVMQ